MEALRPPVILDEIQNTPELFNYIRTRIDSVPKRKGQWFLTGSQESPLKQQVNRGERVELYYFRDQQGLEVDFIVPRARARLVLVEAKASTTVTPAMAQSVGRLAMAVTGYRSSSFVVHGGAERHAAGRASSPGVEAVTLPELLAELGDRGFQNPPPQGIRCPLAHG